MSFWRQISLFKFVQLTKLAYFLLQFLKSCPVSSATGKGLSDVRTSLSGPLAVLTKTSPTADAVVVVAATELM